MSEQLKQPVTEGVAKVPVVMQLEALECGAASLTMILAYYGKWIPLEQVRSDCGVSRDGSNAKNIMAAARKYGLKTKAYRFEPLGLRVSGTFPCIIHWNFNHFVVLNGFKGDKAYLNDPAEGAVAVPMEIFDKSFTGICITFEPSETFQPSGKPKSILEFARDRVKGTEKAALFTLLVSVIGGLTALISPAFNRVFMDRLLTGQSPLWVTPFLWLLFGFIVFRIVMSGIEDVYSLRINGKMAVSGNTEFLWKILKMPMEFFSQRMAGDIQARQQYNGEIAKMLVNTFAPLVIDVALLIFYLALMFRYSWVLALIGLAALALNILVSRAVSDRRVNITRVMMRDSAALASYSIAGMDLIENIKASGAEDGFFTKWAGYHASVNRQRVKLEKSTQFLSMIPELVNALANDAVLIIGVLLTMRGEFTVGMVMAFQGFLGAFMTPALTLISAGEMLHEMRVQMERVDDVMKYPEEQTFAPDGQTENREKLTGNITVSHLTFGYSKLANPLITDFNLTLQPGRSVAFVGGTGSGKSTLSRLIAGLYRPWEGEILYDGKPQIAIPRDVFASSLTVVDQEVVLFKDTIANNIRMWDDTITDEAMIAAAEDARIHEDIMARPGGYNHPLHEGGKDFSGGQRQRMEIARALALQSNILILDEATSALDAKTEFEVMEAVRRRGMTLIVVAHRLSTVRSCDEIIVLYHGEIVDRGTHNELMDRCEAYRELVISE